MCEFNCIDDVKLGADDKTYLIINNVNHDAILNYMHDVMKINDLNSEIKIKINQKKTYIMYDGNFKLYKIGKSIDPSFREKTLGAQFPTISLFAVCDKDIESMLHKKYKGKRIRGEWFDLNNDDLKEIMKLGFKVV